jgi:CRP-like cAMP-binding protein
MRLPATVRDRLSRHAKRIRLEVGQAVFHAHEQPRAVYFPETAVVSCLAHVKDGQTLQVGLFGSDGMAGISVLPGAFMAYDGVVQVAGTALKVDADAMARELRHPGPAHDLLGRYAWVRLGHSIQTAACNNFHSVGKRCARLLLMMHDLMERDDFPITQDLLALMLGVRRASVTRAAQALQRAGAIAYKHGHLTVRDRRRLEAASCECYGAMRETYQRLLGD